MHFPFFCLSLLAIVVSARDPRHAGRRAAERVNGAGRQAYGEPVRAERAEPVKRAPPKIIVQNANTTKYAVNGTAIPDVDWDIGESYAGLMPISSAKNASQYYFWFFPSSNPNATDDITIWLNGGPGCSALEGFLQENGPFLWQYGTYKPVRNPWTWVNLTNMLWVEQPAGTGFSQGLSYETSEEEVAKNFLGFMRNFEDTFSFRNKNIYISGESYAGMYVPYIADAMFSAKDKTYFNVQGTMIYDPSINSDTVLAGMQVVPYVNAFENLFNLNDTYMSSLRTQHTECGYADFLSKHFVYPPRSRGPMPSPPKTRNAKCGTIWSDIQQAVTRVNPCFNIYDIATTCPVLWDVLGFPGSFEYLPKGASIYFDRADVQKAINAPNVKWAECNDIALQKDTSLYSGLDGGPLTRVIDQSQRTIIAHGNFDFILLANGTLMSIQNMTWGGSRGFQQKPKNDFFVPYHNEREKGSLAASGVMGVTHTERKLTWVEVFLSGHMVPQYQPSAAYRQMEFLLGRIASLEEVSAFTTQPGVAQPVLGKGAGTYAGNGSVPSRELFGEGEDRRVRLVTDRGFL